MLTVLAKQQADHYRQQGLTVVCTHVPAITLTIRFDGGLVDTFHLPPNYTLLGVECELRRRHPSLSRVRLHADHQRSTKDHHTYWCLPQHTGGGSDSLTLANVTCSLGTTIRATTSTCLALLPYTPPVAPWLQWLHAPPPPTEATTTPSEESQPGAPLDVIITTTGAIATTLATAHQAELESPPRRRSLDEPEAFEAGCVRSAVVTFSSCFLP